MYRGSQYEIHNKTMMEFVKLFNECKECRNLEICPNLEETYGNDGWIIDHETQKKIGYDWERRDDHFKNGVLQFSTLGQYERKLMKDNIQISLQCDEDNTAVAVGWHKDWLEEIKVVRELKTDTDIKQNGSVRYTSKFTIYKYDKIADLKKYIDECMKSGSYEFSLEDMINNIFETDKRFSQLDEYQRKAVLCKKKYELVVAGAGAGKTTTVAAKVDRLILDGTDPKKILVMTLTREARSELQSRIKNKDVYICTFHSLGFAILGKEEKKVVSDSIHFSYGYIKSKIEKKNWDDTDKNLIKTLIDYLELWDEFCDREREYLETIGKIRVEDEGDAANVDSPDEISGMIKDLNEEMKRSFLKAMIAEKWLDELSEKLDSFIEMMKLMGRKVDDLDVWGKQAEEECDDQKIGFLSICKECFTEYLKYTTDNQIVDYSDMINMAGEKLKTPVKDHKEDPHVMSFDYIIIDEYQDISAPRAELIKALVKYSNTKQIMVVGDDWQSIYGFSGSRVDLFTRFKENMEARDEDFEKIALEYNRRNPQSLIDIASHFIMKNQSQLEKKLKSVGRSDVKDPVIKLSCSPNTQTWACLKILQRIRDEVMAAKGDLNGYKVLVLGRYQATGRWLCHETFGLDMAPDEDKCPIPVKLFDMDGDRLIPLKEIVTDENGKELRLKDTDETLKKMDIRYMTAHRSKGTEADQVILLGMEESDAYGFPSKIKDDELISLVKGGDFQEGKEYPEERRLFYVALTRSKNHVYLLGDLQIEEYECIKRKIPYVIKTGGKKESSFVQELRKDGHLKDDEYYQNRARELFIEWEEKRADWVKNGTYEIAGATGAEQLVWGYKVLSTIRDISVRNNAWSVTEDTLYDTLKGEETELTKRNRGKGWTLKELNSFGILKDLKPSMIRSLLMLMASKDFIYYGSSTRPSGNMVRYGKSEIRHWNEMCGNEEESIAFIKGVSPVRDENDIRIETEKRAEDNPPNMIPSIKNI